MNPEQPQPATPPDGNADTLLAAALSIAEQTEGDQRDDGLHWLGDKLADFGRQQGEAKR